MFHGQDWGPMNQYLRHVQRVHGVALRCVGANYMTGLTNISTVGFTSVTSYHQELDFHVGIAPLIHTPFNERKSWIKVLEYAARGIPCVASNVGQYGEWVGHGFNGFLVDDLYDMRGWVGALEALLDDGERTRIGENALANAREWTIGRQVHHWVNAYGG